MSHQPSPEKALHRELRAIWRAAGKLSGGQPVGASADVEGVHYEVRQLTRTYQWSRHPMGGSDVQWRPIALVTGRESLRRLDGAVMDDGTRDASLATLREFAAHHDEIARQIHHHAAQIRAARVAAQRGAREHSTGILRRRGLHHVLGV